MWIIGAILIVIALSGLAAMSTIAQPTITVFADRSLGETSPLLFGANHCYHAVVQPRGIAPLENRSTSGSGEQGATSTYGHYALLTI